MQNKGAIMGCSNPHPHGQAWSTSTIPSYPATELASLLAYSQSKPTPSNAPKGPRDNPCLLCEYAHYEVNAVDRPRVVTMNDHWVALVPWWAVWPFEILRKLCVMIFKVIDLCTHSTQSSPTSSTFPPCSISHQKRKPHLRMFSQR